MSVIFPLSRLIQLIVAISQTATDVPFCSVTNTCEGKGPPVVNTSFIAASDNVVTVLTTYPAARRLSAVVAVLVGVGVLVAAV